MTSSGRAGNLYDVDARWGDVGPGASNGGSVNAAAAPFVRQ